MLEGLTSVFGKRTGVPLLPKHQLKIFNILHLISLNTVTRCHFRKNGNLVGMGGVSPHVSRSLSRCFSTMYNIASKLHAGYTDLVTVFNASHILFFGTNTNSNELSLTPGNFQRKFPGSMYKIPYRNYVQLVHLGSIHCCTST